MTEFTPVQSLIGGSLIGLAAVLVLLIQGRVMGISGILGRIVEKPARLDWRIWFLIGVITGPLVFSLLLSSGSPYHLPEKISLDVWQIVLGAVLVGVGTRMGAGCTSGHGVCGIGRLSKRSFVATIIFMFVAVTTVFVFRHLFVM